MCEGRRFIGSSFCCLQIAQKIFQGYPASVVCKDVGLCSSKKIDVVAKATNGIGCTICTLIVGYAGLALFF